MTLNEQAKALHQEYVQAEDDPKFYKAVGGLVDFVVSLPPVIPLVDVAAAIKAERDIVTIDQTKTVDRLAQRLADTLPEAGRAAFLQQCGVQP